MNEKLNILEQLDTYIDLLIEEEMNATYIHCGTISYIQLQNELQKKFGIDEKVYVELYRGKVLVHNEEVGLRDILFMEDGY